MSREELQVNFRMPAWLKRELEQLAKENHRSLTAEIVARLQKSVEDEMDEILSEPLEPVTDEPPSPRRITTAVNKETLLMTEFRMSPEEERMFEVVYSAIKKASMIPSADPDKSESNSGPKPRKRFPKA